MTLLIACTVITSLLLVKQIDDQAWVKHTLSVRSLLVQTLSTLQDAETGQRGLLLTGDESFLEPFNTATWQIDANFENLAQAVSDNPSQTQKLNRLRSIAIQRISSLRERMDGHRLAPDSPINVEGLKRGKRLMDEARAVIAQMISEEDALLATRNVASRWASYGTEGGILGTLILAAILGWTILRDSRRQVVEAKRMNTALQGALALANEEGERRERLESQLRQSQKMEALGQLTGGIAHDFNNMLAIIIGSLNLLKRQMARGETDTLRFVEQAMGGAERAATLTHRLLAFSRQQPLEPQTVDANKLVAGISEVVRRTLGEGIKVETILAGGLWRTHVDVNQLESVLLNLSVNARDAMRGGGKLTIETANASLDEEYARQHVGVLPGQYVLIAVTDTGTGMSADVIARAFDPFFTTKELGKGTGLGLSQVYGFVKQSGGHIKIYSEPGHGTTVKVYLPRFLGEGEAADADLHKSVSASASQPCRDEQLVLVVDDEEQMRRVAVEMFQDLGYSVVHAESGAKALALIEANPGLTLLFTDVVMPDMNGRALAEEALHRRPGLKVLFTTGFNRNAVIHNGVLDPDVSFLPKPFTVEQLAQKLLTVLGPS